VFHTPVSFSHNVVFVFHNSPAIGGVVEGVGVLVGVSVFVGVIVIVGVTDGVLVIVGVGVGAIGNIKSTGHTQVDAV
jgi:hypothetical protein